MFAVTGFPDSIEPAPTVQSIEMLHLVPKLWMGLIALTDTFLIYKIVQSRYKDQRIALFAALLFAVMPMSWITRRILLDTLLLPFLLSSILLALQFGNSKSNKQHGLLVLSGVCAGLAIFTKVPAFAAMPLIGLIIYSGSAGAKWRNIGIWLIPALLIPALWPISSISEGHFDYWLTSVLSQTQRNSDGISTIFENFWKIDPVLLVLGTIGIAYCIVVKRDWLPLLWFAPFMAVFSITYVQYFHVIPLLPVFCIATGSALCRIALLRHYASLDSRLLPWSFRQI